MYYPIKNQFKLPFIFLTLIFIFSFKNLLAKEGQIDTNNAISRLLQKLSNSGKKDNKNYVLIELNYGFTTPNFFGNDINEKFDNLNSLDIKYGFYHEDRKIKLNDFFKFRNEFIQFGNKSSYMNLFDKTHNEFTQESWVASFGTTNGYGIKELNLPILGDYDLLLAHSMSLELNRIDIEQTSMNPNFQRIFDKYDENYKFGNSFSSSLILRYNNKLNFRIGYEDRLVFSDFPFLKWSGSYLLDIVLLKIPEVYEDDLIKEFGNYYPYMLFLYQTLYSYGTYCLKANDSYFPFNSDIPLRYTGVIIGISLTFDN